MTTKNKTEFIRYGKSSKEMLEHKEDFFQKNDEMVDILTSMNKLYAEQPQRLSCKNCDNKLGKSDFKKLHVNYTICQICGHLNGLNEDSEFFCSKVYTFNKGSDYSKVYNSSTKEIFKKRTNDIYAPKASFLKDALENFSINPKNLKFVDIGAGSGYFVSAMKNLNLNISGYEVSEQQVSFGNSIIGEPILNQMNINETLKIIEEIDADVITMIGVLEHLRQPRKILNALCSNKQINFLYISVPLFSLSVFFEMIFSKVMHRQLSGAHTHLYTEQSLEYMTNEFKLNRIASWWFGTDMMDLYRSVSVALSNENYQSNITDLWKDSFSTIIDPLQLELDHKHMSSEVHMLFALNK
jgi:2-polyprenyl-3-methyl-5-hydroxy-6-metoxy-1,4-benzoquinol methylase